MPALGMRLAALDQWPVLAGLGMSLGLGLLIGIQRGWTLRHEADGSRFAGIRTFGLLGLAGGLAGAIEPLDRVAAWIVFGVAALLIPLGYVRTGRGNGGVSGTAVKVLGKPIVDGGRYSIAGCERAGEPLDVVCRMKGTHDPVVLPMTVHQALRQYLAKHPVIGPKREGRAKAVDLPPSILSQDHILLGGH